MRPQEEMTAAIAEHMRLTEGQVIYMAVNRLYLDLFPVEVSEDEITDKDWEAYCRLHGNPGPISRGRSGERTILDLIGETESGNRLTGS
ncbi:MAG: hypothetical protein A2286_13415 [Gammaproteobacteria bacterium RIFOXYA12_FULL_61_12]|nr:MAG: hypothetical protein A2286_13415 [Gammaproteobacteria bacterium RIFOXYA12_FULL_61_12]OGT91203.1 MAG: hypothetical protein A2514_02995 [Gammaproteobacteria bacterium RIFOXYD12_FULL_61_37]